MASILDFLAQGRALLASFKCRLTSIAPVPAVTSWLLFWLVAVLPTIRQAVAIEDDPPLAVFFFREVAAKLLTTTLLQFMAACYLNAWPANRLLRAAALLVLTPIVVVAANVAASYAVTWFNQWSSHTIPKTEFSFY